MSIKRTLLSFLVIFTLISQALLAEGKGEFDLFVRYYREKDYAMAKNLAKNLVEEPAYRYHVKVILSEIYFQENDLYYAENLLKELMEEYPEKTAELQKRLDKVYKERHFVSRDSSDSNKRIDIYMSEGKQKDEEILSLVSRFADEAYDQAGKFFEWYPETQIQIILYFGSEYNDYTIFPVWSQGGYDGKLRIMVRKPMASNLLKELIFHEYAHLVIQGVTKGNCPLWFNEAVAQYFSRIYGTKEELSYEKPEYNYLQFPKNWLSLPQDEVKRLYKESLMILLSIVKKSDPTVILSTLKALGAGKNFEEALNSALSIYGLNLKDL